MDLGTTIIETLEKFKQTLSAKSINLSTNIKNNVFVNGDRIRIEQVLQNIILNAVDFLPEKDGRLDVVLSSDENYSTVSIVDNGIGISQDKITKLFDRFYQIDASYTREHGGSGLGLSICKAIIDKHDGIIGAHSEGKGKGSTFFFKIPLLK
jgi:two-component system phosphate regulon sensor histidine kinase PhoR